jgi:hypothetical protein
VAKNEVIEFKGVIQTQQALKLFAPDLQKEMMKEINAAIKDVVGAAKRYVVSEPGNLFNWPGLTTLGPKTRQEVVEGIRPFPKWDPMEVRAGIKKKVRQRGKYVNQYGFAITAAAQNMSAAGSIYEFAGRGRPPRNNRSDNPNASEWFKNRMQTEHLVPRGSKGIGRLVFRAGKENEGDARKRILRAQYVADQKMQQRLKETDVWKING